MQGLTLTKNTCRRLTWLSVGLCFVLLYSCPVRKYVLIRQHASVSNSTAKIIYLGRRGAKTVAFESVRDMRPLLLLDFALFRLGVAPTNERLAASAMRNNAIDGAPPGWLMDRRLLI
jgi:hypothetical protein